MVKMYIKKKPALTLNNFFWAFNRCLQIIKWSDNICHYTTKDTFPLLSEETICSVALL